MKKIYLIILSFYSLHLFGANSNFENLTDTTIIIIENYINSDNFRFQTEINSEIVFEQKRRFNNKDTIVIESSSPFRLVSSSLDSNKQHIYYTFWLYANDTVVIRKIRNETIAYSHKNKTRDNELNFFIKMQKDLGNFEGILTYLPHKRKSPISLYESIKQLYEKRLYFLESYKKQYPISLEFENFLKNTFYLSQYKDFFEYSISEGIKISDLGSNKIIVSFLNDIQENKSQFSTIYAQEAHYFREHFKNLNNGNYFEFYEKMKSTLSGNLKEFVLFKILEESTKNPNFGQLVKDFLNSDYSDILKNIVSFEYKDYIKSGKILKIPAYNETQTSLLLNLKTQKYIKWEDILKLDGIKYIDFWATWCGGCRTEFPKSKELTNEFQNKDIKFIYVSIDENFEAWEKISIKEGIPAENSYLLINPTKSLISIENEITSIPRYLIADKNGTIINKRAPRPSDKNIKGMLDNYLK